MKNNDSTIFELALFAIILSAMLSLLAAILIKELFVIPLPVIEINEEPEIPTEIVSDDFSEGYEMKRIECSGELYKLRRELDTKFKQALQQRQLQYSQWKGTECVCKKCETPRPESELESCQKKLSDILNRNFLTK